MISAPCFRRRLRAGGWLLSKMGHNHSEIAKLLSELARTFYARSWVLGTSGNFSAIISENPFRMAITSAGVDKGTLTPDQVVLVDESGKVVEGIGRASAETAIHLAVVRVCNAGAVLHTHSVWSTMLSDLYGAKQGISIEGYEMLKGLKGIDSHMHREWLPILDNDQDILALAHSVEMVLRRNPNTHGFLLRGHGLYTWGDDLSEAKRHVEILEFLLELIGRTRAFAASAS